MIYASTQVAGKEKSVGLAMSNDARTRLSFGVIELLPTRASAVAGSLSAVKSQYDDLVLLLSED